VNKKNPWTEEEKKILSKLNTPAKIQIFLDELTYNSNWKTGSPREVMKHRRSHCFDGALFAAAALRNIGYKPQIMDLRAFSNDDDHVLAVYKKNGKWGCIGKSNFTTLRSREPVYKSIREMAMSYFDFYFNSIGEKTLHEYSVPMNLEKFDKYNWMTTDGDVDYISGHLDKVRHFEVMDAKTAKNMPKASAILIKAGILGSDPNGLFKIKP